MASQSSTQRGGALSDVTNDQRNPLASAAEKSTTITATMSQIDSHSAGTNVKVAVRVRPFNKREIEMNSPCVIAMKKTPNGESTTIAKKPYTKTYTFDNSFWSFNSKDSHFVTQKEVFDKVGKPVVDNIFEGFNSTIFAYGQTGSGKTYCMMGGVEDDRGIIPRLCEELFDRIEQDQNYTITVEMQYYEIYNERVFDLLARHDVKSKKKPPLLKVRESPAIGPYVQGITSFAVEDTKSINALIAQGQASRHVGATAMNAESSRSHAVLMLNVTHKIKAGANSGEFTEEELEKTSRLNLVDLAGSERQNKSRAQGQRLAEGNSINKSLSTLGMVINALVKATNNTSTKGTKHIPYRDSVLTWLLKESFGGNSKTVMIATISPASDNYDETMSTLRYADNAKQIINKAIINEGASAKIIRELQDQIETLKKTLNEKNEAKLREAERLLVERTQTYEEKLNRTKTELLERLKFAENQAAAAFLQAATEEKISVAKSRSISRMRWHNAVRLILIQSRLSLMAHDRSLKSRIQSNPTDKSTLRKGASSTLSSTEAIDRHLTKLSVTFSASDLQLRNLRQQLLDAKTKAAETEKRSGETIQSLTRAKEVDLNQIKELEQHIEKLNRTLADQQQAACDESALHLKEIAEKREMIKSLTKSNTELTDALTNLRKESKEEVNKHDSTHKELINVQSLLQTTREQLKTMEESMRELHRQHGRLEKDFEIAVQAASEHDKHADEQNLRIEKLSSELVLRQSKLTDHVGKIVKLQNKTSELESNVLDHVTTISHLNIAIQTHKDEVKDRDIQFVKLETQLSTATDDLEQQSGIVTELREQIANISETCDTLLSEKHKVETQLAEERSNSYTYQQSVSQLEGELRDTQGELGRSVQHVKTLEKQVQQNEQNLDKLEIKYAELETKNNELRLKHAVEVSSANEDTSRLQGQLNVLQGKYKEAENKMISLSKVFEEKTNILEKTRKELNDNEVEQFKLKETTKAAREAMKLDIKVLEETKLRLAAEISEIQAEFAAVKGRLAETESSLDAATADLITKVQENESLHSKLKDSTSTLAAVELNLEQHVRNHAEIITNLEVKLQDSQFKHEKMRAELVSVKERDSASKAHAETVRVKLQSELEKLNSQVASCLSERDDAIKQCQFIGDAKKSVDANLSVAKAEVQDLHNEVEALKSALKDSEIKFRELQISKHNTETKNEEVLKDLRMQVADGKNDLQIAQEEVFKVNQTMSKIKSDADVAQSTCALKENENSLKIKSLEEECLEFRKIQHRLEVELQVRINELMEAKKKVAVLNLDIDKMQLNYVNETTAAEIREKELVSQADAIKAELYAKISVLEKDMKTAIQDHSSTLNATMSDNQTQNDTIDALNLELEKLKRSIEHLTTDCKEKVSALKELQTTHKNQIIAYEKLQSDYSELQTLHSTSVAFSEKCQTSLRQQIESVKTKFDDLNTMKSKLEEECIQYQSDTAALLDKLNKTSNALDDVQARLDTTTAEQTIAREQIVKLQQNSTATATAASERISDFAEQLACANANLTLITTRNDELISDLEKAKLELQTCSEGLTSKLAVQEDESMKLHDQCERLNGQLLDALKDAQSAKDLNQSLMSQCKASNEIVAQMERETKSTIETMVIEKGDLQGKLASLENEKQVLAREMESQVKALAEVQSQLKAQKSKAESQENKYVQNITDLESSLAIKNTEINDLEAKLSGKEDALKDLQRRFNEAATRFSELEDAHDALKSFHDGTIVDLESKEAHLSAQLEEQSDQMELLVSAKCEVDQQVGMQASKVESLELERAQLSEELNNCKQNLAKATNYKLEMEQRMILLKTAHDDKVAAENNALNRIENLEKEATLLKEQTGTLSEQNKSQAQEIAVLKQEFNNTTSSATTLSNRLRTIILNLEQERDALNEDQARLEGELLSTSTELEKLKHGSIELNSKLLEACSRNENLLKEHSTREGQLTVAVEKADTKCKELQALAENLQKEYQSKESALQNAISVAEQTSREMQTRIDEMATTISEEHLKTQILSEKLNGKTETLHRLQCHFDEMSAALSSLQHSHSVLQADYQELKASDKEGQLQSIIDDLKGKNDTLQDTLSEKETELKSANTLAIQSATKLEAELGQATLQASEMRKSNAILSEKLAFKTEALEKFEEQHKVSEIRSSTIQAELSALQSKFASSEAAHSTQSFHLNTQIEELTSRVSVLLAAKSSADQQYAEAQSAAAVLQEKLTGKLDTLASLQLQLENSNASLITLRNESSANAAQAVAAEVKIQASNDEINFLSDTVAKVKSSNEELHAQARDAAKELSVATMTASEATAALEQIRIETDSRRFEEAAARDALKLALAGKEEVLTGVRERHNESLARIAELNSMLETAKNDTLNQHNMIKKAENTIEDLKSKLFASNQATEQLSAQLTSAQKANATLQEQFTDLQFAVADATASATQASVTEKFLTEKVESLESRCISAEEAKDIATAKVESQLHLLSELEKKNMIAESALLQRDNDMSDAKRKSTEVVDRLSKQIEVFREESAALNTHNRQLSAKVVEFEKALYDSQSKASKSESEMTEVISEMEAKCAAAEVAALSGQAALEKIQAELIQKASELGEVSMYEKQLNIVKSDLAAKSSEFEKQTVKLDEVQSSLESLTDTHSKSKETHSQQVAALSTTIKCLEASLSDSNESEKKLEAILTDKEASMVMLGLKLQTLQESESRLMLENASLEEDILKYKEAFHSHVAQKAQLSERQVLLEDALDETITNYFSHMWQNDKSEKECTRCKAEYGYFKRRNTCGRCGRGFCSSCACHSGFDHEGKKAKICEGCHGTGLDSVPTSPVKSISSASDGGLEYQAPH